MIDSTPDYPSALNDQLQFSQLVVGRNLVADDGRGEATLGTEPKSV
jgi:hypothetical protein